LFSTKFVNVLGRIGKPVVVRKKQGDAWIDCMDVAEIQQVSLKQDLVVAGVLQLGDAVAYFPSWANLSVDDRVIQQAEFVVSQVARKQVGDETVYVQALLKAAHDTVAANFYGPDRIFFDDFEENRESWTVISGSWNVVVGQYVGQSGGLALSVAGQSTWENYVVEARVTVESGSAGLVFRFFDGDYLFVALRPDEGVAALEAVVEAVWSRIKKVDYHVDVGAEYTVRAHCFGSFVMVFLNGEYLFTVSDLNIKKGQIGAVVLGGKARFDDFTVWGAA